MEALRACTTESDLSDFHELRQGFIPPAVAHGRTRCPIEREDVDFLSLMRIDYGEQKIKI